MSENRGGEAPSGATNRENSRGPADKGPPAKVVRYGAMRWVGEFTHKNAAPVVCGARVVVQTERGIELGEVLNPCCSGCEPAAFRTQVQAYVRNSGPDFCRPRTGRILRAANEQDLNEQKHLNAHVREDIDYCAEEAARLSLDMKVITAEHLLGGERIVFYFQAPTRVDFRQLVKELAQRYRTRIEMRQVGARDEARLVADYEVCGRECCCRNFLKKLRPVNMKMAKLQKSTLDPSKVSGRCGRLRCCLRYEHLGYEELAARLPRVGSRVEIEYGPATVLDRQVLTQLVAVRTDDDRIFTLPVDELRTGDVPSAPHKKETDAKSAVTEGAPRSPSAAPQRARQRPPQGAPPPPNATLAPEARPPGAGNGAAQQKANQADRPRSPAPQPVKAPEPAAPENHEKPPDSTTPREAGARSKSASRRRRRRRRQSQSGETKLTSNEGPLG